MFKVWARPWPTAAAVTNSTALHTLLQDGDVYESTLVGEPPEPAYFKFYIDNICKRAVLRVSGLGPYLQYELFVSTDARFPTWSRFSRYKINTLGRDVLFTMDASDLTFKVHQPLFSQELTIACLDRWGGSI